VATAGKHQNLENRYYCSLVLADCIKIRGGNNFE
jgi:hypothetical protein